jgi:putative intracellular protease/amidase
MLEIKKMDISQFENMFSTEEDCLKFISDQKWGGGFVCKKCGHTNFCKGKTLYSRRCTRCKSEESATANTIFHRCHIPITEAMRMVYLICHDPGISTYELSRQLEKRQMTCWKLKAKLMECVEKRGEIDILFSGS